MCQGESYSTSKSLVYFGLIFMRGEVMTSSEAGI